MRWESKLWVRGNIYAYYGHCSLIPHDPCFIMMYLQTSLVVQMHYEVNVAVQAICRAGCYSGRSSVIDRPAMQHQSFRHIGPISGHKCFGTLTLILFMSTQRAAQGVFWWSLFKQKADVDGSFRGPGHIDSGKREPLTGQFKRLEKKNGAGIRGTEGGRIQGASAFSHCSPETTRSFETISLSCNVRKAD